MSNQQFYRFPFAAAGDKAEIPEATQADGTVSLNQGFGFDYERDPSTDPDAKNIQRDDFNGILFDVTDNLRQYQLNGVPEWVTSAQNGGTAVSYAKFARVRYDTAGDGTGWQVFESATADNTSTPGADGNWTVVVNSTYYAQDTGTANTYQAAYTPSAPTLRDGLVLGFTAKTANSGPSTFSPDGTAAKPVVGEGLLDLQGGEILAGSRCAVIWASALSKWVLLYATGGSRQVANASQSAQALNLGQAIGNFSAPAGLLRNASMNVATPSASATFSAEEIIIKTSLTGQPYRLVNFSQSINLGGTGAGGMDVGAAPVNGYVALYAIYNPTSKVSALLATNATTSKAPSIYGGSAMPAGFTASALVSVWPTNASGQLAIAYQTDRTFYTTLVQVLNTMVGQSSWAALSISSAAPPNAREVSGLAVTNSSPNASNNSWAVAGNSAGVGYQSSGSNNSGNQSNFTRIPVIEQQKIYYQIFFGSAPTSAGVYISSYTI